VPTILVADDNSNIQKMVGIALKDQGITVVAVGNGEAAVRKLAETVPDLILADIFMPVRNGYEVCDYVKKDERFAHIPVVLLVGAFDPLDEKEVERVHADGVLNKPFVPPDPLIELVKSFLGKAAEAAAAAEAGPGPAETQELEHEEDVDRTQDVVPGLDAYSPTGTLRLPASEVPVTERTQRLTPEPAARPSSGTIEMKRPEIPSVDKTQRLTPEGTPVPVSADNFRLGLEEPPPPVQLEETQKLTVTDISNILKRETTLKPPPPEPEAEEEFSVPPAAVEFHGEEAPVAFADMLDVTEKEEGAAEEPAPVEEAESPEIVEEPDEAAVRFGGIREEAKTPDPERPPIPVDFGHSEPVELITEEHMEPSGMQVGPAEDLVTSSSGWAASTGSGAPHAGSEGEPGLMTGGAETIMTPPTPASRGGIAGEEVVPSHEFVIPPEAPPAAPPAAEVEEAELPKHILQEEVDRAQEIAARVAAQNREFAAREEAQGPVAGPPLRGPGIDHVIPAADTILARHRAEAAAGAAAPPVAEPPAAPPPSALAAPPAEAVAPTVVVPRASSPELIEAISERVLSQLDPYLIEKISKEIVRPMVEAMIRRELEKLE